MPSVKRIEKTIHAPWWQKGEECVILRLDYLTKQRLQKKLLNSSIEDGGGDDPQVDVSFDDDAMERSNVEILTAAIVSMTDEDANPIELSAEVIESIYGLDGEYILVQINELNPTLRGLRKAKGGPFPDADADSSGDGAEEGEPATG